MRLEINVPERVRAEHAKQELPTLEEKVDALLEGGQKLAQLKRRIEDVKRKHRID